MKKSLWCVALLCTAAVAVGQDTPRPADATKADPATANTLDGTWTVVSVEKKGEPMKDAKDMTVTVKDNTLTCSGKDGKPAMTVRFEFAGPGQARVTMDEGTGTATAERRDDKAGSKPAVYVLTSEYLAVCIHDEPGTGGEGKGGEGKVTTSKPSAKSHCSIVLKRSGERR